jgi:DNA replicative helicase MCM subunit Mcm2 (Cdc46/Mcm family)
MLQGIDPESLRKDEDAEFLTYKIGSRARTNGVLYSKEEMSAYLGYVRESVAMPTLSPEAAEIIKTFFLGMRSNPSSKDLPVTIRQL